MYAGVNGSLSPVAYLVPQQYFCRGALPASIPAGAYHKGACGIEVELADNAGAMAGDDEEGCCCCVCGSGGPGCARGGVGEVVLAEDVVGCAGYVSGW